MVHPFISSQTLHFGRVGGLTISVAAHASLIALAVAGTGRAFTPGDLAAAQRPRAERLVFVEPARLVSTARGIASRTARAVARLKRPRWQVPDLAALHMAIERSLTMDNQVPPVQEELDFGALASQHIDIGTDQIGKLASGVLGRVLKPNAGDAYTQDVVERIVWPHQGNPRPVYPLFLLQARVEASFTVTYVVDSTGRVDDRTISIPSTAHRQFAESVRSALRRSRFYPAQLGGRVVRQLVQQRFVFRIGESD